MSAKADADMPARTSMLTTRARARMMTSAVATATVHIPDGPDWDALDSLTNGARPRCAEGLARCSSARRAAGLIRNFISFSSSVLKMPYLTWAGWGFFRLNEGESAPQLETEEEEAARIEKRIRALQTTASSKRRRQQAVEEVADEELGVVAGSFGGYDGTYFGQAFRFVADYVGALPETDEPPILPGDDAQYAWWTPFAFPVNKPHRRVYNSCQKMKNDYGNCILKSPCFQSGAEFHECAHSRDLSWVTQECHDLRFGYEQCRRDFHRRNEIWQFGNRWSS
eukprot:g18772.t1